MIYRTLHTYILRELLRVFLLTASALTTLMAFGGMLRPVTKQGIDVSQVMVILVNLMPAMLAYAIPIAALFAAVLVYWRMSTDNELTACRAGGVSFVAIVMPAFMLGLAVASIDLVFVNYVVPRFLQSTERAVLRDLGSLIVSQVGRQERFQYDRLMVTADSAEEVPSGLPDVSTVVLHGFAGTVLDSQGRPVGTAVGQKATLTIHNMADLGVTEIDIKLENTSGFNPANAFQKVSGSVTTLSPDGRPLRLPSYFRNKPKFLNWKDLIHYSKHWDEFSWVSDVTERIVVQYTYDTINTNTLEWWKRESPKNNDSVSFAQVSLGGGGAGAAQSSNRIILHATRATIAPTGPAQQALTFTGEKPGAVRVESQVNGKIGITYTCDAASLTLSVDQYTGSGVNAGLLLQGNVKMTNNLQPAAGTIEKDNVSIPDMVLDPSLKAVDPSFANLKAYADGSARADVQKLNVEVTRQQQRLFQTIDSELHSRGSFSLSCLTLVLLGAALGILMRGKNPLAVFVVGFVPAIALVLLITAGRQLTEGNPRNVTAGIIMIWAGNGLLLVIVAAVFGKLLRR